MALLSRTGAERLAFAAARTHGPALGSRRAFPILDDITNSVLSSCGDAWPRDLELSALVSAGDPASVRLANLVRLPATEAARDSADLAEIVFTLAKSRCIDADDSL